MYDLPPFPFISYAENVQGENPGRSMVCLAEWCAPVKQKNIFLKCKNYAGESVACLSGQDTL